MVSFGRIACVALPFLLTLASLIALLVAGLSGVTGNKDGSMAMFRINLTDLQVPPSAFQGLTRRSAMPDDTTTSLSSKIDQIAKELSSGGSEKAKELGSTIQQMAKDSGESVNQIAQQIANKTGVSASDLITQATNALSGNGVNITASMIGLNQLYDVNLWNLCYESTAGNRTCPDPKFNYAKGEINETLAEIKRRAATVNTLAGTNITIPKDVTDGLNTFAEVVRWTEIVFIIATIALGLALILGIVANFSRAVSCLTWIIQGVATAAVIAFASLATATAVVVVGLVEGTAKIYGARANFNSGYLAAVWISVAFSIAAGVFWLATVCCCKPDDRRSKRNSDAEKLVGSNNSSYAPVQGGNGYYNNNNTSYGAPRYPQGGRSDSAYEPYSHAR
ncbi:hypothetical protein MCOR25_001089 [Pyricularia grisea]|uniref:SUR7 protein n=1 Tax=Pyricularia grisea TaxID=148305 RepID=A0A6P8ANE6_PYRGI|nr:uncharacterized protein PgNI_11715 [Pyricularia grisea]KAI6381614.1 hypothetical protein MCOR25_001089 [Pyricularia grisea]TLD03558.1 hypothetical protein PgNI_11715 [Pyricularia grisea]